MSNLRDRLLNIKFDDKDTKILSKFNKYVGEKVEDKRLKQIRTIAPIEEWINSEYYLGNIARDIFPYWKETIIEFFNSPDKKNLGIFYGSLGGGKTFTSCVIIARLIYELSCYNYPALKFNLSASTGIVIYLLAPTIEIAERTAFGDLKSIIDQSPYFIEEYPRDKNVNSKALFGDGKVCVYTGSKAENFLGQNLLCLLMDEASFQRGSEDNSKFQKASGIFRESLNRRKSRFMVDGVDQSLGLIASSADTITSFTEQIIEENINNPNSLIKKIRKYEVDPHKSYSEKRFNVFIGEKNNEPFVLDKESEHKYKNLLEYFGYSQDEISKWVKELDKPIEKIEIPEEHSNLFEDPPIDFFNSFKLDCIKSLGEVCGCAVQSTMKFFGDMQKYYQCVSSRIEHPFYKENICVSTKITENELIGNLKKDFFGKSETNYYGHIDLSKTGDSTGFVIGHWDNRIKKCIVDMVIRIDPPESPHKIDYEKILQFVWFLKTERRFRFKQITFDQYQSEFFIQFFDKRRIKSCIYSVDRDDSKYIFLRNKLITNEIELYLHSQTEFELKNLIHYIGKQKVDHPQQKSVYAKDGGYSKDTTDALCAVVNNVFMIEGYIESNKGSTLRSMIDNINESKIEKYKDTLKMEEKRLGCKLQKAGM